jgi:GH24 family phage-related lysozyme (muramidase)
MATNALQISPANSNRPYLVDPPTARTAFATDPEVIWFARKVIAFEEGFRSTAYKDHVGVWTIGYGRTENVTPDSRTTREAEDEWLDKRLTAIAEQLEFRIAHPLPICCWAALISWQFNVGDAAAARSTLLDRAVRRRFELVDDELLRWTRVRDRATGRQRVDPILRARRAAEAQLWNYGLAAMAAAAATAAAPEPASSEPVVAPEIEPEPVDVLQTGTGRTALTVGSAGSFGVLLNALANLQFREHAELVAFLVCTALLIYVVWILWRRARA